MLEEIAEAAARKLEWIMQREGDLDGERKKPYYLAQLMAEEIRRRTLTGYFEAIKRDCPHEAGQSNDQPHYSMVKQQMQ